MNAKKSVYQHVTDRVLEMLGSGDLPFWRKPWNPPTLPPGVPHVPHNAITRRPYSGVNVLLAQGSMMINDWSDPRFMTMEQANACGGRVRKGEHGTMVVFWQKIEKKGARDEPAENDAKPKGRAGVIDLDAEDGESVKVASAKARYIPYVYTVFNLQQITGIPKKFIPPVADGAPIGDDTHHAIIKAYLNHLAENFGADIRFGGSKAFFRHGTNIIQLPEPHHFRTLAGFAGTVLHEATHFTGPLLDRDMGTLGESLDVYAREEVVAELGAWMQAVRMGVPVEEDQAASYIDGWRSRLISAMDKDAKFIFRAAKDAHRAAEHLLTPEFMMGVDLLRGFDASMDDYMANEAMDTHVAAPYSSVESPKNNGLSAFGLS